jgi:hypothetical protein
MVFSGDRVMPCWSCTNYGYLYPYGAHSKVDLVSALVPYAVKLRHHMDRPRVGSCEIQVGTVLLEPVLGSV